MSSLRKIFLRIFPLVLILISNARPDWPCRGDMAVPVSTNAGNQWNAHLVSDGGNGSIIAWQDRRNGLTDKIYLQKMSSSGSALWTGGGIQIASTGGFQYYPQLIADGSGGAFIVWQDNRDNLDYDVYVQHVSANGVMQWYPNGTLVCNAVGHQYNPQIAPDGRGGIVVSWQDRRSGQFDIYAQRFDADGRSQWSGNGQVVCSSPNDQLEPKMLPDGTGGAIMTWIDFRSGNGFTDVYCQRLNSGGSPMWLNQGVPVCVAPNTQWNIQLTDDGLGNCIVVWQDRRAGSFDNIYAQKIDVNGGIAWAQDGIPVAPTTGVQYYPQIASDRSGGAFVTWQDNRLGSDYNIYAQHLDAGGQQVWSTSGLSICSAKGHQYNPQIISQGSSAIITWQDRRNGDFDIYAQRLTSAGSGMWGDDGTTIVEMPLDQFLPQLVTDNINGAIFAWADYQNGGGTTDIYAHRIGANGKLAGGCFRSFQQQMFSGKGTRVHTRYSRVVLNMPNEGNVRDSLFGRGAFATGILLGIQRPDSNRIYGWEYFTRSFYVRNALPQNGAPRPFDYIYDRKFVNRLRNPSVYRYDNRLAGELLTLRLNIAASDAGITETGFGDLVYRDTSLKPNTSLDHKSLRALASTVDSLLSYWKWYPGVDYKALANTLGAINSSFAGRFDTSSTIPLRVSPMGPLFSRQHLIPGTDPPPQIPAFIAQEVDEEVPDGFALFQNYPNPFNPITTIEFSLIEPSLVSLRIYNTLGQEMAKVIDGVVMDEGRQLVDVEASKLSSGVYFYRLVADPVSAPGKLVTRVKKMILLK